LEVVFSEDQIQKRVSELALEISRDYGDEVVHVVGIMENCLVFLADLVRKLTGPVACHFTKMETRDTVMGSQPVRSIGYDPIADVEGKNILLVDALVESGITLDHLVQQLLLKKPKSVRTVALVDREDRRRLPFRVNYAGFAWSGGHLVGYGMAKDGLYRNLPYVAAMTPAANGRSGDAQQGGGLTK
jgi:hypoxanthine phosphoribosyltransferase